MFSGTIAVADTEYRAEASIVGNGVVFELNPSANERAARLRFLAFSDEDHTRTFEAIGHMVPEEGWVFSGVGDDVTLSSPSTITLAITGGTATETWRAWVSLAFTQNYAT